MQHLVIKALKKVLSEQSFPPFKLLDLTLIHNLIDALKHMNNSNDFEYILKNKSFSITDFGWSLLYYFKNGKLDWTDITKFQTKYRPKGKLDILSADWLARNIINYNLEDKVPRGSELFKNA